jgi:hypothetical protein
MISLQISAHSAMDTLVFEPFGTNITPNRTGSGEIMTITAFTTDSASFFLYDMADRSIAQFDSNGIFLRKIVLQSIGRETYIGDDFVVRGSEAIFLNTVDSRLEYFNMNRGNLTKSLPYPRQIPTISQQRRYRMITRIFLDNSRIYIGNTHAVFPFDESLVLQKVSASQVRTFSAGSLLILYTTKNPVLFKSGIIEWNKKKIQIKESGYPLSGKRIAIMNGTLYICSVSNSGVTIMSTGLSE